MRAGTEISLLLGLILGLTMISPCQTNSPGSTPHQACVQSSRPTTSTQPARPGSVVYSNYRYSFRFYLPKSWKGFTVIESKWEGTINSNKSSEDGPLIRIRHPLYTEQNPREDIPIMVFTCDQWREINNDDLDDALLVSAAPFPPSEIGRNQKYVFATPPRYLNDLLDGFEEVMKIMNSKPLQPLRITEAR
jgi:hypothetical protein